MYKQPAFLADKNVKATYRFPLPENAAVCRFECEFNGNKITGIIKEKEEARQIFNDVVSEGKQAALLEQDERQPDIFEITIGNIALPMLPPSSSTLATDNQRDINNNESIIVTKLTYVQELLHNDSPNEVRFHLLSKHLQDRYTLGTSPPFQKYHEKPSQEASFVNRVFASNTNSNNDVNNPLNSLPSVQISINMPAPVRSISSPSHASVIKVQNGTSATPEMKFERLMERGLIPDSVKKNIMTKGTGNSNQMMGSRASGMGGGGGQRRNLEMQMRIKLMLEDDSDMPYDPTKSVVTLEHANSDLSYGGSTTFGESFGSADRAYLDREMVVVVKADGLDKPRCMCERHPVDGSHALALTLVPRFALKEVFMCCHHQHYSCDDVNQHNSLLFPMIVLYNTPHHRSSQKSSSSSTAPAPCPANASPKPPARYTYSSAPYLLTPSSILLVSVPNTSPCSQTAPWNTMNGI
jgi:hypothetical protein